MLGAQTVRRLGPKTTKYRIYVAHTLRGLQALRVNKNGERKHFERKRMDIHVLFLFEIQHFRACEFRAIEFDV